MMKSFFFSSLLILSLGCGGTSTSQEGGIVETPSDGDISVADIIRNPISANGMVDSSKVAKMVFEETTFEFGTIDEGEVVKHVFKFKNEGTVPLLISSARSTCGCTVPKWPREPIAPGEGGEISIRFNSDGKKNKQTKPVTINANTLPAETKLYIKGHVTPKNK